MKLYLSKYLFSIIVFIVSLEILLRVSKKYETRSEHKFGNYSYKYRVKRPNWYYTNLPNSSRLKKEHEWQYFNKYNEFGNREKSILLYLNDTTSVKVICLGDSFTEGDGAPYDSSWVRKYERMLNENRNKKFSIYNAGACGSDVFYNYKILVNKLMIIKPNIVIECINSTDINDIIWRGGAERFNNDGTVSGKVGPAWEFIYRISHVFRALMTYFYKYNKNLISENDLLLKEEYAASQIIGQVEQTANFCLINNIKYYLLLHPLPHELKPNSKQPSLLINELQKKDFATILFEPFKDYYNTSNIDNDYWPMNKHFNSKGYFNMGNIIYSKLKIE